jgi:hypothetical protein
MSITSFLKSLFNKPVVEQDAFINIDRYTESALRLALEAKIWQKEQQVKKDFPITRIPCQKRIHIEGGYEGMVKDILAQAARPLRVKKILKLMGPKYKSKKQSVSACLYRCTRANKTFFRDGPCFGLLEWE